MPSSSAVTNKKSIPLVPIAVAAAVALALLAGFVFLNHPAQKTVDGSASQEVKAYIANLALSDVSMQASENLVNQKVVEVLGNISNNGPRELASIDVYCLFYGVDGHLLHQERLRIVSGSLKPGATKSFRMPFDSLPDGWNQALPKMVIAQIAFVN
jgi:hypothetical protein